MQLYFVKATYTNNVYKVGDFFLSGDYKVDANKMLDINFKPSDGLSQFITSNITLADTTSISDHTHVIVPSYNKIYKIIAIDYLNVDQYQVIVDEDPLIGNYLDLIEEDVILHRTNDPDYFRGVNDIADLGLKETVTTTMFQSEAKTGKWALLFMQINESKSRYGLKFDNYVAVQSFEQFASLAQIVTAYPEVTTDNPSLYSYYQKIVFDSILLKTYQCVYYEIAGIGSLKWVVYSSLSVTERWFKIQDAVGARFSEGDIRNLVIALPFENDIEGKSTGQKLLSWQNFIGPVDSGELIDIKIVDDIVIPIDTISYSYNGTTRVMLKTIGSTNNSILLVEAYNSETATTVCTTCSFMSVLAFEKDLALDPGYITTTASPLQAEPFYKYDLYVFGKKFVIPYYLTDDIHLLIAINSGVINYTLYYNDKRNIIASGSFTHSLRYAVDMLDAFYNQNPTYKEQFFVKMGTDSIKTIASGAIGGSVVPGLGTLAGAGLGIASAGVDAGLSLVNLHYQEKSLTIKPDQIFGEISEVAMQLINVFGIYFVKRTPENINLMLTEYYLKGFPTAVVEQIDDLSFVTSFFGTSKVVYGELKKVVRNQYTTAFINQKLKEGIILIP